LAYSNEITVHLITGRNPRARQPLHAAFANMRDGPEEVKAFSKRWAVRPVDSDPLEPLLIPIRNLIRVAWRAGSSLDTISKGPARLHPEIALLISKHELAPIESAVTARIRVTAGRTEVVPDHWWQTAWLLYLRDREQGKTAICANPDCPAPYFIRKRRTQKFCESGCVEYGAAQRSQRWWQLHGAEWRSRRKSGKGKT
jgi:hypothetical protein